MTDEIENLLDLGKKWLLESPPNYEEALKCFSEILALKPRHMEALKEQGNAFKNLGKYQASLEAYDLAISILSEKFNQYFNKGKWEKKIGEILNSNLNIEKSNKYGQDLQDLRQVREIVQKIDSTHQKSDPNEIEAEAWYTLGIQQLSLGNQKNAVRYLDRTIGLKPAHHKAWFNRGHALHDLGLFEDAITSLQKSISIVPEDCQAWYLRGNAFLRLEFFEEAISNFEEASRLCPDFHDVWHDRGIALFHLDQNEEALSSFDKANECRSNCAGAWEGRGATLYKLARYEEAIDSYNESIKIDPNNPQAWNIRGLALQELNSYEEAILSFKESIKLTPDFFDFWQNHGLALDKLDRSQEAIYSLRMAAELNSDDSQSWYNLGRTLIKYGYKEESISSLKKAIELNLNDYASLYLLGTIMAELGCYQEAIQNYYDKVISIKNDYSDAWVARGSALGYLNHYEQAISSYDKAIVIQYDNYMAWYNRGLVAGLLITPDPFWIALSPLVKKHPDLNLRGYIGQLTSYEVGLNYVPKETHPEGWGYLHWQIGKVHYIRGEGDSWPRHYWQLSIAEFNHALETLTAHDYPELHLEVLQDYIFTNLRLGRIPKATELSRQGTDLLQRLLSTPHRSDWKKQQLALKFASFDQLTVDIALHNGQSVQALELAEQSKNTCLSWLLGTPPDQLISPTYDQIQTLLQPTTAILYWHLSPIALTTFILKPGTTEPIVLTPQSQAAKAEYPLTLQQLRAFEEWCKDWNQQYTSYLATTNKLEKHTHSWQMHMPERLEKLKQILELPTLLDELTNINQLILIPHRDLHRFPLHALFPDRFTITTLPSAQIGIDRHQHTPSPNPSLLNIAYPNSTNPNPTKKLVRLEFPVLETHALQSMFRTTTVQAEDQATKANVTAALQAPHTILHFSGHAAYNSNAPIQSELALTGPERLTLADICQIPLHTYDLVTLSACETAVTGNHSITTEYVGLVSGFLRSGVNQVVSSLWTVQSMSTALLMIRFYEYLQGGHTAAKALKQSQQWLRQLTVKELCERYQIWLNQLPSTERTLRPFLKTELRKHSNMDETLTPFAAPYYWAAFTITGPLPPASDPYPPS